MRTRCVMTLRRAIERYHELLTPEVAAESQGLLDEQLLTRGLFFGDRALCTVLRPRLLLGEQYGYVQQQCVLLLAAFARALRAALGDPAVLDQFGLEDWERTLVEFDPGFREASPTSRLDAFYDADAGPLYFTEYNAETPAGLAYGDALSDAFLALPVAGDFLREYELRPLPARHGVLFPLLDSFRSWRGAREQPRIAILDWREVPTYNEFVLFERYFHALGIPCVIADPRDVAYDNGRLVCGDFHITLIYKRVLLSELVARGGIDHPVIRAVRDRAACMVNPFRCKILHKKASLAVLSDERNAHLFTAEQRDAIDAHIPWTRVVAERTTVYQGDRIDLVPWIAANRDALVLKPNDEYGGKGIVLGWEVDDDTWADALASALEAPSIVQRRIRLPTEPYPSFVDGSVQFTDRMVDLAPFVSHGRYVEGCLTRLGTTPLLNVTAGGGSTVPTFVTARR